MTPVGVVAIFAGLWVVWTAYMKISVKPLAKDETTWAKWHHNFLIYGGLFSFGFIMVVMVLTIVAMVLMIIIEPFRMLGRWLGRKLTPSAPTQ